MSSNLQERNQVLEFELLRQKLEAQTTEAINKAVGAASGGMGRGAPQPQCGQQPWGVPPWGRGGGAQNFTCYRCHQPGHRANDINCPLNQDLLQKAQQVLSTSGVDKSLEKEEELRRAREDLALVRRQLETLQTQQTCQTSSPASSNGQPPRSPAQPLGNAKLDAVVAKMTTLEENQGTIMVALDEIRTGFDAIAAGVLEVGTKMDLLGKASKAAAHESNIIKGKHIHMAAETDSIKTIVGKLDSVVTDVNAKCLAIGRQGATRGAKLNNVEAMLGTVAKAISMSLSQEEGYAPYEDNPVGEEGRYEDPDVDLQGNMEEFDEGAGTHAGAPEQAQVDLTGGSPRVAQKRYVNAIPQPEVGVDPRPRRARQVPARLSMATPPVMAGDKRTSGAGSSSGERPRRRINMGGD